MTDRRARLAVQAAATASAAAALVGAVPVVRVMMEHGTEFGMLAFLPGFLVPALLLACAVGTSVGSRVAAVAALLVFVAGQAVSAVSVIVNVGAQWAWRANYAALVLDIAISLTLLAGVWGTRRLHHLRRDAVLKARLDALADGGLQVDA